MANEYRIHKLNANHHSVVGNVWLVMYETSNIVTDLMLMALPFTLICSITIPITQ